MISRYEATLNGISLESINPAILLTDISYDPPSRRYSTYAVAKRDGSRVYRAYKEKSSVTVQFAIREYDTMKRQSICQQICAWARNGGTLRTNDRDGQMLKCICEQLPSIPSVLQWTEPLSITFAAYELPYWQDVNLSTLTLSGTSNNGTIYIPGSAPDTVMEVEVTAGAEITALELTVEDTTLTLSGLSVASGNSIVISYDDHMIQSIKTGSTSLLNKRTGADDLIAKCGQFNLVSYTANASCDVTFRGRGLWE